MRLIGVEAVLLFGAPLAQQIPVAVEGDADLLEAAMLLGREAALTLGRSVEPVFLGDEFLDVALNLTVVHPGSFVEGQNELIAGSVQGFFPLNSAGSVTLSGAMCHEREWEGG